MFNVVFNGGVVMGLSVVSLGLLGVGGFFLLFGKGEFVSVISGFVMGVSLIVFFVCVGGGIYTKIVDVGFDFVGKVEVGIFEDDPRNLGVIVDNVGDCVGDMVGLGVDIFEFYCGVMIVAIVIGFSMFVMKFEYMVFLVIIVMVGFIVLIIGIRVMDVLED